MLSMSDIPTSGVSSVNTSLQSSERHLDPGKPGAKQKLSILGSLGDSSCSVGSEALSSVAPILVLHPSSAVPLIHLTANAMSKGTDLSSMMTKSLEADCACRICP